MRNNSIKGLAVAGAFAGAVALQPSAASAFHGNLVDCHPSAAVAGIMNLKPGLNCTDSLNKITVSLNAKGGNQIDNCVGNFATGIWTAWAAANFGSKASATDVSAINKADVSMKAVVYGICDFNGDVNSSGTSGAGKFQFYDPTGTPIKTGKGSFFGVVKVQGVQALASGVVTKGFGVGSTIEATMNIDLVACAGNPNCMQFLACNVVGCPPAGSTLVTQLNIVGGGAARVIIQIPSNSDCIAPGDPLSCCTGAGIGTC